MIETIGALFFAFLGAVLAALFAFVALLGSLLPFAPLLLAILLPVALVVVVLRRTGVIKSRLATFAALIAGIVLLTAFADRSWPLSISGMRQWFAENREILAACRAQENAVIRFDFAGGAHFSCSFPKKRDGALGDKDG